jgi:hypothetical protein
MNFLTNIDLNKNQLINPVLHNVATDPASAVEGQLIYRTDTDEIKYYDGSSWLSITAGAISDFSVAGDTGSVTITDGDTLTISGASSGISTSVSGSTVSVTLANITNAELQNSSVTLANSDGHLSFTNSGVVALGSSITIDTVNLVDIDSTQTITGDKTFSGDVVISGNLDVTGTVTNIDSTNLLVEDALIVVARNQSTGALDAGIVVERGTDDSQAMFWDESADQFVFANVGTEDGSTSGNVTISSYSAVQMGNTTTAQLTVGTLATNNSATSMLVENGSGVVQKATISTVLSSNAVTSIATSDTAPLNLSVDSATGDVTLTGSVDLATDAQARSSTSDVVLITAGNLRATEHAETISGTGSATSFTVTHNMGTRDVMVQVYDTTAYETVITEVTRTSTSVVTIDFGFAPAVGKNYRVLIKIIGNSIN